ncbi:unnamed protein product [Blepharisma stoltei]|uniref:Uncharacterized protein n=1 Tax=Blepharisma stoltei TaxID=1481888 RepID=A0AAU9JBX6_9CILI|nr:unnamed protein product [Blepharisma stoltei]
MSFDLNRLFNYSELTKVLEWIITQIKSQDNHIKDIKAAQAVFQTKSEDMDSSIKIIQEKCTTFEEGLETINKISDKVTSWSERFRVLEEKNFQFSIDIENLKNSFEASTDEIKLEGRRNYDQISNELRREFAIKISETDKGFTNQVARTIDEIDKLRNDLHFATDRVNEVADHVNVMDTVTAPIDINPAMLRRPSIRRTDIRSNTIAAEVPISHFHALSSRVTALESKYNDYFEAQEAREIRNLLKVDDLNLKDKRVMDDVAIEVQERYAKLVDEMRSLKILLEAGNSDIVHEDSDSEKAPKSKKYLSIIDRIFKLERSTKETKRFKDNLEKISKSIEEHQKLIREIKESQAPTQAVLKIVETIDPPAENPHLLRPRSGSFDISSLTSSLSRHEEIIDFIHKTLPTLATKIELEETVNSIGLKIKDAAKHQTVPEEVTEKLNEFEQRLNGFWKENKDFLEAFAKIEAWRKDVENDLNYITDVKVSTIEQRLLNLEISHNRRGSEENEKIVKEVQSTFSAESEQYFRSMIIGLRTDIVKLKDSVEHVKKDIENEKNLFHIDSETAIDEMQDPNNTSKIIATLKKHGSAIRFLANRLAPGSDDKIFKVYEANAQLSYLEELKKEMKEMINKQESSKSLSSKEVELIQEIYVMLDSKINKQELGKKVDKAEMQRIYRLLKNRIDDVANNVKKNEMTSSRGEDAFFSKKRLDMECASCGQFLPEKVDQQRWYYEAWNRFPANKTSSFGPGFSKILNSLVMSPTGSFGLPTKRCESTTPDMLHTGTSTAVPASRKNAIKRNKLPTMRL